MFRCAAYFFLGGCLLLSASFLKASEKDEDPTRENKKIGLEIQHILDQNKANFESIITWQGKASVHFTEYTTSDGDEIIKEIVSDISFAKDQVSGNYFSLSRCSKNDVIDGGVSQKHPLGIAGEMFCDGKSYSFSNNDPSGPLHNPSTIGSEPTDDLESYVELDASYPSTHLKGMLLIRKGKHRKNNFNPPSSEFLNPFDYLLVSPRPLYQELNNLSKLLLNGKDTPGFISMAQDGDKTVITHNISHSKEKPIVLKYIFNKEGLLLNQLTSQEGSFRIFSETNYEKQEGIWLPNQIKYVLNMGKWRYNIQFKESIINETLPEDTFSLASIGVMQGDRAINVDSDEHFDITDPSLSRRDLTSHLKSAKSMAFRYVIIAVGLMLILVAVVRIFLRKRIETKKI